MTTWTNDELSRIDAVNELQIETRRADGTLRKPVTIWVVRVGDELYVRSVRGREGDWFRHAMQTQEGRISAGGVERDVTFERADDSRNDAIDEVYRRKYRQAGATYVDPMVAPAARETTIRLVPRETPA